ncbi:MAG: hypothetical protein LBG28_08790 [Tannerella sp.]|jgi:hypothetical protein|nr:hypothetical protein [Tannerella sp.]
MKIFYRIILLLIIASFTGCKQKDTESIAELKEINRRLENESNAAKEAERIEREIYRRTIKYSQTPFDDSQVFWGKDSVNIFSLKELALSPRLVFCFSINTCTPCIDSAIELIKEIFTDFECNETIIITGDYPLRLRDNCYGKRMLSDIKLPVTEVEAPFFFVLDKSMKMSFLHIFNKMNPEATKIYLEEIREKLSL